MIFVTVGSQMPFDRLLKAVDDWAEKQSPIPEIRAQHGGGGYKPKFMVGVEKLTPIEFERCCESSTLVIAHAGMGSILTAITLGKPIVILPRRGDLKETRNDHQISTARWLSSRPGVFVASTEAELGTCIERGLTHAAVARESLDAPEPFIRALKQFIDK